MKHKNVTLICPQCGATFVLGLTGTRSVGAASLCDKCQGIERDADGCAWRPWETEITGLGPRPETHKSWKGGR